MSSVPFGETIPTRFRTTRRGKAPTCRGGGRCLRGARLVVDRCQVVCGASAGPRTRPPVSGTFSSTVPPSLSATGGSSNMGSRRSQHGEGSPMRPRGDCETMGWLRTHEHQEDPDVVHAREHHQLHPSGTPPRSQYRTPQRAISTPETAAPACLVAADAHQPERAVAGCIDSSPRCLTVRVLADRQGPRDPDRTPRHGPIDLGRCHRSTIWVWTFLSALATSRSWSVRSLMPSACRVRSSSLAVRLVSARPAWCSGSRRITQAMLGSCGVLAMTSPRRARSGRFATLPARWTGLSGVR